MNTSTLHCGYGTPEPLLSSANVLLLLYRLKGPLGGGAFSIEFIHITGNIKYAYL